MSKGLGATEFCAIELDSAAELDSEVSVAVAEIATWLC